MDDVDEITRGSQFLSPTGRIWTVRTITPNGNRVYLTSDEPDGEHGAVMDAVAVGRMVRIDRSDSTTDVEHIDAPLAEEEARGMVESRGAGG